MTANLAKLPYMIVADGEGAVFEHPYLRMAVASGQDHLPATAGELIPLPAGADLHVLPGRRPVGMDPATGRLEVVHALDGRPVFAASAFLPPAYTVLGWAAFFREDSAPTLPLYAYAALGWDRDSLVTPAVRIDPDTRQDLDNFPADGSEDRAAAAATARRPDNRLVAHLAHCCRVYRCPAARNLFLRRYEAPLPTSTGCNARCIGCISLQEDGCVRSTQERIAFTPTAREVAEVAVGHLETATDPIVSFGQGCEGEPLTVWPLLEESIALIRERTLRGTINLNTNASDPKALKKLFAAGLDSMRVSLNSARPDLYEKYFRPVNYGLADVIESMAMAARMDRFVSLNYFVFPGVTDAPEELQALTGLKDATGFRMIQWRNLNIDPDVYLDCLGTVSGGGALGVAEVIRRLRERYPDLIHGYFNPYLG